jgi:hypothetical protein
MSAYVIDTNVLVVASGRHLQAQPKCIGECIVVLRQVQQQGKVVLDAGTLILDEYKANLSLSGQPGVGDAFFKWLWDRQYVPESCERVPITPTNGSFSEFPSDPELRRFHADDRKFVAVAVESRSTPEVLNAVDPHWWTFREALQRCGVRINFLCPESFQVNRRRRAERRRRGRETR